MSRVAIIGAGPVGRTLGRGLADAGHDVTFGVRGPDDARRRELAPSPVAEPVDAAASADVVVVAVPAGAVVEVVPALGLRPGQVVVDATNAVGAPVPQGFATMGALVASLVPAGVEVVKAFNTIGAEHLADGRIDGRSLFLPVAGDTEGLDIVVALASDLGFAPVPLGGRDSFGLVEDHARLWIHLVFACGWGRDFGFTVARP